MLNNNEIEKMFASAVTDSQKVTLAQLYYTKRIYELLLEQNTPAEVKNVLDKKTTPRKGKPTT